MLIYKSNNPVVHERKLLVCVRCHPAQASLARRVGLSAQLLKGLLWLYPDLHAAHPRQVVKA